MKQALALALALYHQPGKPPLAMHVVNFNEDALTVDLAYEKDGNPVLVGIPVAEEAKDGHATEYKGDAKPKPAKDPADGEGDSKLKKEHASLLENHEKLKKDHHQLQSDYTELKKQLTDERKKSDIIAAQNEKLTLRLADKVESKLESIEKPAAKPEGK